MTTRCVFCKLIEDEEYEENWGECVLLTPLNPVVDGHKLVIPVDHAKDASHDANGAADAMFVAAEYIRRENIQANIITSVGSNATQTVFHTHVHIVPRTADDKVKLPWTGQRKKKMI